MENLLWHSFKYNGLETNIQVSKCGKFKRNKKDCFNTEIFNYKDFKKNNNGYIRISVKINNIGFKNIYFHQILASTFLNYNFGNYPNEVVDHIDSNKLNNNLDNLRIITQRENTSKEKTIKSGLPVGVSYNKERNNYTAQIYIKPNKVKLGRYKTIEEASDAYQNKLKEISNG